MGLQEDFEKAASDVKNLKETPNNQEMLDIYGLYKQATVGDNNTDKPGIFDPKGRAKHDAWTSRKDLSKDEAMSQYIDKVKILIETYGLK